MGNIRSDRPLALNQLVDVPHWDADIVRHMPDADAPGGEKFFEDDSARVDVRYGSMRHG